MWNVNICRQNWVIYNVISMGSVIKKDIFVYIFLTSNSVKVAFSLLDW